MKLLLSRSFWVGVLPLLAALCAMVVTFWSDLTVSSIESWINSPHRIIGFFAKTYPLFGFVVIYALTRLLMVALTGTKPLLPLRLALWLPAALLILGASLYPTFGGFLARGGYAIGGIGFTQDLPPLLANSLGGALFGLLFSLVLGLAHALIDWNWTLNLGRVMRGMFAMLSLAFAGSVLVLGWPMVRGASRFPEAPLEGHVLLLSLVLLAVALLPHVLVSIWSDRAR